MAASPRLRPRESGTFRGLLWRQEEKALPPGHHLARLGGEAVVQVVDEVSGPLAVRLKQVVVQWDDELDARLDGELGGLAII